MGTLYNRKYYGCRVCDRKHYARGYCHYHYQRLLSEKPFKARPCLVLNCTHAVGHHITPQLCSDHRQKYMRRLRCGSAPEISQGMVIDKIESTTKNWYVKYRKIISFKKTFCESCGATNVMLYIHHKDKNKRNHDEKNIITVCGKCHFSKYHIGEIGRKKKNKCQPPLTFR